jgi:hypothetical protein
VIRESHRTAYTAALFVLAAAASAEGQTYHREDIVRGVCRKDGCDDFTID